MAIIGTFTKQDGGSFAGSLATLATGIAPAFAEGPVIAFLMPCSTCADRFEGQDKPLFIEALKKLDPGATVIANNAQGSAEAQVSQAEAQIVAPRAAARAESPALLPVRALSVFAAEPQPAVAAPVLPIAAAPLADIRLNE